MYLGHGGRSTAHAIQENDGDGKRLGQNWIILKETFFVAQFRQTEFGGENKENLGIKNMVKQEDWSQILFFFCKNLNWEQWYYRSLGNLLKLF